MQKHDFTDPERFAVYTVHGKRCYLCREPLNLSWMQVDHLIPESLLANPKVLAETLASLGRAPTFDVNSFANWMPSCVPCNIKKRDKVFDPSLKIQLLLQEAEEKAGTAAEYAREVVNAQQLSRAINTLARKRAATGLPQWAIERLRSLHEQHQETAARPIQLSGDNLLALKIRFSGGPRDGETVSSGSDELAMDEAKLLLSTTAGIARWVDAGLASPGSFFTWKQPHRYLVELGKKQGWSGDEFKTRMKYDLYDVNSHEWGESTLILKAEYEGMD